jgi:hypothetical protein
LLGARLGVDDLASGLLAGGFDVMVCAFAGRRISK